MVDETSPKLEECRVTDGPLASRAVDGLNGAFIIPISLFRTTYGKESVSCIVSDGRVPEDDPGYGWEHVSACVRTNDGRTRTPDWRLMSAIKDVFWKPSETVMQLHVDRESHVNCHPNVLHLWRPIPELLGEQIPRPPIELVGPRRKRRPDR